jgi:hypothetical protein
MLTNKPASELCFLYPPEAAFNTNPLRCGLGLLIIGSRRRLESIISKPTALASGGYIYFVLSIRRRRRLGLFLPLLI